MAASEIRTVRQFALPSLLVALTGVAVSAYLTIEHYRASAPFACPATAAINCVKVTTSRWSHIFGVPVAVLGLTFFLAMALLCSPPAWRIRALDSLRVVGASGGVGFALYLVWVELYRVGAICLWCTAAHVLALLLLISVLWATSTARTGAVSEIG